MDLAAVLTCTAFVTRYMYAAAQRRPALLLLLPFDVPETLKELVALEGVAEGIDGGARDAARSGSREGFAPDGWEAGSGTRRSTGARGVRDGRVNRHGHWHWHWRGPGRGSGYGSGSVVKARVERVVQQIAVEEGVDVVQVVVGSG